MTINITLRSSHDYLDAFDLVDPCCLELVKRLQGRPGSMGPPLPLLLQATVLLEQVQ